MQNYLTVHVKYRVSHIDPIYFDRLILYRYGNIDDLTFTPSTTGWGTGTVTPVPHPAYRDILFKTNNFLSYESIYRII